MIILPSRRANRASGGYPPWQSLHGTPNTSVAVATNPAGMFYTGPEIGFVSRTNSNSVHLWDIANPPTFDSTIAMPSGNQWGATVDDSGNLIVCSSTTNLIYQFVGMSNTIDFSFATPGSFCRGLCWTPDNLLSYDAVTGLIYIHDGVSSTVDSSFSAPAAASAFCGLAYDGTNLITGTRATINMHSGITSSVDSTIAAPATACVGVVWDGVNLWSSDDITDKIYCHDGFSVFVP